jgi:hypothetical protein
MSDRGFGNTNFSTDHFHSCTLHYSEGNYSIQPSSQASGSHFGAERNIAMLRTKIVAPLRLLTQKETSLGQQINEVSTRTNDDGRRTSRHVTCMRHVAQLSYRNECCSDGKAPNAVVDVSNTLSTYRRCQLMDRFVHDLLNLLTTN